WKDEKNDTPKKRVGWAGNKNHPKKGSTHIVSPITEINHINKIKEMLLHNPRNYALFTVGINTGLRASELCLLKKKDVKDLQPGDVLKIKQPKTKKFRDVTFNRSSIEAIKNLLLKKPELRDNQQLFSGRKGAISTITICALVKKWCKEINLPHNYGSHTLRKTFGYHQRVTHKIGIEELMKIFGHSSPSQTMTYICVQPEEIKAVYMNDI
ncbi:tyrosine-type recombinase/integrase, partial [Candidatus Latescibacterota bacterium]